MSDVATARTRRKVIAAGVTGNVLEWYDFAVYGFYAPIIGKLFFPSDDPTVSLIASFGAFAAGFLMRPSAGSSSDISATRSAASARLFFPSC